MSTTRLLWFVASIVLICGSAGADVRPVTQSAPAKEVHGMFRIYYFPDHIPFRMHTYNYDESWLTFLRQAPLTQALVEEADIAGYDWKAQQIHLTSTASVRLQAFFNEHGLDRLPFIVALGEERFYAGVFLNPGSAMAINYPVIYPWKSKASGGPSDLDTLTIVPFHSVTIPNFEKFPAESRARIAIEKIKERFKLIGKLR